MKFYITRIPKSLRVGEFKIYYMYYKYFNVNGRKVQRIIEIFNSNMIFAAQYKNLNDPMEGYFLNNGSLNRDEINIIKYNKQQIRICSFTKEDTSKLMWAHYANGFKGIVIGFDIEQGYNIEKIKYSGLLELSEIPILENQFNQIFTRKFDEWSYENEYRVILNNEGETIKVVPKELIFGLRTPKKIKVNLSENVENIIFKQQNIHFENVII